MRHLNLAFVVLTATLIVAAAAARAQEDWNNPLSRGLTRIVPESAYDGSFHFCRVSFRSTTQGDGDGWFVDYPRADQNLSIRLGEITRASVSRDPRGNPVHVVMPLADPALFSVRS